MKKKTTWKDKLQHWFDEQMSHGSLSLLKLLTVITVMEENHIVVLGFEPGEYTLIQELVYGADKRPCCIVVVGEADREEMEDAIRNNVKCPKNVRILCRSINVLDPDELARCSLDTCRTVLISPADVDRTVQTLLSVTRIFHNAGLTTLSPSEFARGRTFI